MIALKRGQSCPRHLGRSTRPPRGAACSESVFGLRNTFPRDSKNLRITRITDGPVSPHQLLHRVAPGVICKLRAG